MSHLDDLGGWPVLLAKLMAGGDLTATEIHSAVSVMLDGAATSAQISAFIVALRIKGETAEELGGCLDALIDAGTVAIINDPATALDIVGTGGDRSHSINVSTMAAIVAAGAGARVCKHGNRGASSKCGAADLLEELGVVIELGPVGVARCVDEIGIGFCLAPKFHPAVRHVGPVRRELGVPTVFNILGPMANPGRAGRRLVGVADGAMAERMVGVMGARGVNRALVVHGDDGLDELSTTGTSRVFELSNGVVTSYVVEPLDFGIARAAMADLVGGERDHNAAVAHAVLAGEIGPARDIVLLNAGAGLYAAGLVASIADGITAATTSIDSGAAGAKLDALVELSQALTSE